MPLAYIALGANLPSPAGPPAATLAAAAERLAALGRITARSSLYSTAPVGLTASAPLPQRRRRPLEPISPRAPCSTPCSPSSATSAATAPPRSPMAPAPSTSTFFSTAISSSCEPGLEIPHPRLAQRAFVLVPLAEIAPYARDPRSGSTAAELLAALSPAADPAAVTCTTSPLWLAE